MICSHSSKPHFHHTLHGKLHGGDITLELSRSEAAAIIKKWNLAIRRSARGHRTFFIMHVHKGKSWNKLVVETHHHRARMGRAEHRPHFATLPQFS